MSAIDKVLGSIPSFGSRILFMYISERAADGRNTALVETLTIGGSQVSCWHGRKASPVRGSFVLFSNDFTLT